MQIFLNPFKAILLTAVLVLTGVGPSLAGPSVDWWNNEFDNSTDGYLDAFLDGQDGLLEAYVDMLTDYVEGLIQAVPFENDMDALKTAYDKLTLMEWQVGVLINQNRHDPNLLRKLFNLKARIFVAQATIQRRWIDLGGTLKELEDRVSQDQSLPPFIDKDAPRN